MASRLGSTRTTLTGGVKENPRRALSFSAGKAGFGWHELTKIRHDIAAHPTWPRTLTSESCRANATSAAGCCQGLEQRFQRRAGWFSCTVLRLKKNI